MLFINHILKYKESVSKAADDFFKKKLEESKDSRLEFYQESLKKIQSSLVGGKMLRSGIFLRSFEILSTTAPGEEQIKLALALEIIQTSLLIHDDIMDHSLLRRGLPSVLAQFSKLNGEELGQALTICCADFGFFLAWELLNDLKNENKESLKLISSEFQNVCIAQMSDVYYSHVNVSLSEDKILNLYRLKTARYSFSLPLMIASSLNGDKNILELEKIGENLGLLFQIKDDYLDLFGDSKLTGKEIGNDIKDNKKTLFYFYIYESKRNASMFEEIKNLFGKTNSSQKELALVKKFIKENLIDKKVEEISKKLEVENLKLIKSIKNNELKIMLSELQALNKNRTS